MKTFTPKPADLTHDWYIIDATDVVLGRLSSQAAILLRGKNKPTYAPHADSGNHVIIIRSAIKGMLPKNRLAKVQLGRLRIFRGAEHPHTAQQPQVFEIAQVSQQAK